VPVNQTISYRTDDPIIYNLTFDNFLFSIYSSGNNIGFNGTQLVLTKKWTWRTHLGVFCYVNIVSSIH